MSARDVVGLVRLGGGDSSVLIKIRGRLSPKCSLEDLRAEIEAILRECGLTVTQFAVKRVKAKAKKARKKKKK